MWLAAQQRETREAGEVFKHSVFNEDHWKAVELTCRVLTPVLKLLRLTDRKTGATLGKIYHVMSELSASFDAPIEGMDDDVREKLSALFMALDLFSHALVHRCILPRSPIHFG